MLTRLFTQLLALKPSFATLFTGMSVVADVAVWQDAIKGWAGTLTILFGAPTALFLLVYWSLKAREMAKSQFPNFFNKK